MVLKDAKLELNGFKRCKTGVEWFWEDAKLELYGFEKMQNNKTN